MATRKKKAETQAQRIAAALSGDDAALRERGMSVVLDFVLDQPLATYLDADAAVALMVEASTGPNAATQIERHLRPGWDRHVARCEENGETPGDAIPADVRDRIVRLITTTRPPKAEWSKDAVDPKLIRELFAPVVQEFLLGFARKLPLPGVGARDESAASGASRGSGFGIRNRLKQSVEKRTAGIVEASKSVLGGLSAEVERQIQSAARDFSESAHRDVRDALLNRLRSDEGRRLLTEIVTQAVDRVLDTPLSEMNADVDALPWDEIWALVPPIVEHNREREPIVETVRAELEAVLAVEGERTVRELLDEAGTLDRTVALVLEHADAPARAFFGSDPFVDWVDALLEV